MLLALDDTDGLGGGCTTHSALALLEHLGARHHLVLRDHPRLVRLNPNVPHKTRGNGAVVLDLGSAHGPAENIGAWNGRPLQVFRAAKEVGPNHQLLEAAWAFVSKVAQKESQPGIVLAARALPHELYRTAVTTRFDAHEARHEAGHLGLPHRFHGTGRSLAGCLGALAWPGDAATFEWLAYREADRCGTTRAVHAAPLLDLDASRATFHTSDGDRLLCVPHGPDPVLVGLRLRDPRDADRVRDALLAAAGETLEGHCLWRTNHASGDHVLPVSRAAEAPPWCTIALGASVAGDASSGPGGHVAVVLRDGGGDAFTAMAFEPTGALCGAVRQLVTGDVVHVTGAWDAGTLRLEKLRVDHLVPVHDKVANPACPSCGKRMKSSGAGEPFRCRDCGTQAPREAATYAPRERMVTLGWHEADAGARRHLHRPVAWS
jgi:tRNA(Ile2)-agmatinylcytidine synthase